VDRITDYNVAADTIRIDNAVFSGLSAGALAGSAFVRNSTGNAADASDRIIYESDTGKLYFDRDGTGSAAKVHFATLSTGLSLTQADFFVF
jgi:serralysin